MRYIKTKQLTYTHNPTTATRNSKVVSFGLILLIYIAVYDKEKKLDEERNVPQSAFLGPVLWDKTLPYDGDNFQLEYMDLEEFLSENGIPSSPPQHEQSQCPQQHQQQHQQQTTVSVMDLSSRVNTSIHTSMVPQPCLQSPTRTGISIVMPEQKQFAIRYVRMNLINEYNIRSDL